METIQEHKLGGGCHHAKNILLNEYQTQEMNELKKSIIANEELIAKTKSKYYVD